MGIEYRLSFVEPDREAIATMLRMLPGVKETIVSRRFDLIATGTDLVAAIVEIEPSDVYFCDFCTGEGRALLGEVIARFASTYEDIKVEEL